MTRRRSILALFVSTVLLALAYGSAFLPGGAPVWAARALAAGTAVMLVAAMALGAARGARGGIGRLAWPFAFVLLLLALAFGYALAVEGVDAPDARLVLGLPRRTAVVLYGIGIVPLFVLPLAYALTFDERSLGEEALERLRAAARAARAEAAARGAPPEHHASAAAAPDRHPSHPAATDLPPGTGRTRTATEA